MSKLSLQLRRQLGTLKQNTCLCVVVLSFSPSIKDPVNSPLLGCAGGLTDTTGLAASLAWTLLVVVNAQGASPDVQLQWVPENHPLPNGSRAHPPITSTDLSQWLIDVGPCFKSDPALCCRLYSRTSLLDQKTHSWLGFSPLLSSPSLTLLPPESTASNNNVSKNPHLRLYLCLGSST